MEGDEALFSLGMVEETWNMLVNVWGWRRVLLFNLTCEVLLIFGGSGFVGLELVSLLCKSGYKIKIFSNTCALRAPVHGSNKGANSRA